MCDYAFHSAACFQCPCSVFPTSDSTLALSHSVFEILKLVGDACMSNYQKIYAFRLIWMLSNDFYTFFFYVRFLHLYETSSVIYAFQNIKKFFGTQKKREMNEQYFPSSEIPTSFGMRYLWRKMERNHNSAGMTGRANIIPFILRDASHIFSRQSHYKFIELPIIHSYNCFVFG